MSPLAPYEWLQQTRRSAAFSHQPSQGGSGRGTALESAPFAKPMGAISSLLLLLTPEVAYMRTGAVAGAYDQHSLSRASFLAYKHKSWPLARVAIPMHRPHCSPGAYKMLVQHMTLPIPSFPPRFFSLLSFFLFFFLSLAPGWAIQFLLRFKVCTLVSKLSFIVLLME